MKHYLIKVHCCGERWIIHAPGLQLWTTTNNRRSIEPVARAMVSDATRTPLAGFEVDLSAGRVLGSEDEFTMAESFAQRWIQSAWRVGCNDARAFGPGERERAGL
ncbi:MULTISPECIES: hypothetical protein [Nocardia]|uniref:hypothetical protein n=1 Tax=Nocardia TaxID=1817 RepID=UPI000A4DF363|nr:MULTISPECIES: hypothetical protein [Nocardia]MBF6278744.1 hypothetical protein [Nocardia nova]